MTPLAVRFLELVMAGLDPAIHALAAVWRRPVDARPAPRFESGPGHDVYVGRRVALLLPLALALAACGKKGDLDAPPGADPARSRDVFEKPR